MFSSKDHVTVCICTYKRKHLLEPLLDKIEKQFREQPFDGSVVVVDNDRDGSARDSVFSFKETTAIPVDYHIEPIQNISLARNRAILNTKGNVIVFIDDDEFPGEGWLHHLYKTYKEYGAGAVLGPIKPCYEVDPPNWVIKGKLHERESFKTGTAITDSRYTRTGNVLISKNILDHSQAVFDPRFGRTGGEDTEFFRKKIHQRCVLIWCEEAPVYENIPPERLKRSYFLKRALLRGVVNGKYAPINIMDTMKSCTAFLLYTMGLPVLFLLGHHLFMKYLIKDFHHVGKLLAMIGIETIKERDDG
jgi:glycosyltransferase involved in cell wall biosynthesis